MQLKSERLKKLEAELGDLEQWLRLGLVPKKDIEKHKEEIQAIQEKIEDEKERLRFIRESGEVEEYTPPKRSGRQSYQEPQSMPEMSAAGETEETSYDMETTSFDTSTSTGEEATPATTTTETVEEDLSSQIYDEDEDPFSDKNRWKRGIWEDPDADQW